MILSHSQKKYIKKNIKNVALSEIAKILEISEGDILIYLKTKWNYEKYTKFINSYESNKSNSLTNRLWVYCLFLFVLVMITYLNSLNNGFVSDDIGAIARNDKIGSFGSVISQPQAFIQPLIYFIINKLFGLNPLFYRIINIIFHSGTVILIFAVITVMNNKIIGLITASLFAVHPILVESVVWISGGNYIRYSFFFFLSFFFYLFIKKSYKLYILSLTFFLLSLFTSEKAAVLSLIILIYEILHEKHGNSWVRITPYFCLTAIWLSLFYFFHIKQRIVDTSLQSYSNFQTNPLIQIPIALTSYLQLILWPDKLTLYHSEMSFSQIEYLVRLAITLGLLGGMAILWKRNRLIFFWLCFFIISLIPTLTPLGISWIVAERYVYLGTVGILFVAGHFLYKLIKNKKTEILGYLLFIIIILSLITRTIIRNKDWKNEDTLWIATGKTSPSDQKTHNNLGDVYYRREDLIKAAEEFKTAIKINPKYADAYHNLANTYSKMASPSSALKYYLLAIRYNPKLWQSYLYIAAIYFDQKKYDSAIKHMEMAIENNPNNDKLYLNLGIIYLQMQNKEKARSALIKSLEINPNNKKVEEILNRL